MSAALNFMDKSYARIWGLIKGIRHEVLRAVILFGTAATLAFFVLYPLGILLKRSLYDYTAHTWTLANYIRFYSEPELYGAFLTTVKLAFVSVVVSLLIALPMAWGVSRTAMPGRTLIRSLVVLVFSTPSFLGAIGWVILLGPRAGLINKPLQAIFGLNYGPFNIYGFWGMVFALSFFLYPFLFFSVAAALDNMDPGYEQAAKILGAGNLKVSLTVTLPLVMPAILSGVALVILESFVVFGAPAVIGAPVHVHTLSTMVYRLFSGDPPQFHMAATAAVPIVLMAGLILVFQKIYLGRKQYQTITGKSPQPELVDIGRWKYVLSAFSFTIVFTGIVLPLLALLQASIIKVWGMPVTWDNLTLNHYISIFTQSDIVVRAFRNSFILAGGTVVVCVLFTFVMAWIVERTTFPGRELLAFLSMIALSIPGVALGLALILAFAGAPFYLYGTLWIFLVGYSVKATPIMFMFARSALKQVHEELEQCARILGAHWAKTMKDITLPLMKKGLLSVGTIVFCMKFRDMPTSIMLYMGGLEVVSVLIYEFSEEANMSSLGALSFLVLVINLALVSISRRLVGKGAFEL